MTENSTQEVVKDLEEYKFGFHDNAELEFTTGLGLTEEVIREISETKNEPEWMLEFRLKSFLCPCPRLDKSQNIFLAFAQLWASLKLFF